MALCSLLSHADLTSSAKSGVGKLPPVGQIPLPVFPTGTYPTPPFHGVSMAAFPKMAQSSSGCQDHYSPQSLEY